VVEEAKLVDTEINGLQKLIEGITGISQMAQAGQSDSVAKCTVLPDLWLLIRCLV
jgi:hypothetical protein